MSESTIATRQQHAHRIAHLGKINSRLFFPIVLFVLVGLPESRAIAVQVLSDAFYQVGIFVYASLCVYYLCTKSLKPETISRYLTRHPVYEVFIAAGLGALPGCGGAIVVVTQYTRGVASFGSVVAVLTSTMGDAAFLLLAQRPAEGGLVMAIGALTGGLTGLLVNYFHNYKPRIKLQGDSQCACSGDVKSSTPFHQRVVKTASIFWLVVALPALAIALLLSFQASPAEYLPISDDTVSLIGTILALMSVVFWALSTKSAGYASITSEDPTHSPLSWRKKAAQDTQFVLVWVIAAFMLFELSVMLLGIDLVSVFSSFGPGVVACAIVIGFLPGCGPQILVTSLYLNGALPFSAQLGNAISNDGDALFPAIALSPKAALLATVYSGIPAFVVGYGYYWLFEL